MVLEQTKTSLPALAVILLFGTLFGISFSTVAHAATVPEMSVEELTYASDAVVVAEVVSMKAEVEKGWVVTTIHLSVDEVWKGEAIDMITIRQRGGRTAELATSVPGMPTFALGERALLFLEGRRPGRFVVTGMAQGKFAIARAPEGTDIVFPASGLHEAESFQSPPLLDPTISNPTALVAVPHVTLDAMRRRVLETEASP